MESSKVRMRLLLALLASLLMIAAAGSQEPSKDKPAGEKKPAVKADPAAIAKLIEQLGSDAFQTREKASRQLAELEEVPDALRRAAEDTDREVARRAQAAITIITNRAEERALQAMLRDLHKVELDRFVRRMVTDKKFAGDKQWKIIEAVAKAVTAEANKSVGRPFPVPDFAATRTRLLLSPETKDRVRGNRSIILSTGATPDINAITNSLVIVDGDFTGATGITNSLLIVRGNVGHVTGVSNSIILATGDWEGGTGLRDSFVQVNNHLIRFGGARNSVLINTLIRTTRDTNSRVINSDRGPLQLLKFSPRPSDAQLDWSKEVDNLTVALAPLDADGQILIRWKNAGKEALQLPWVRFQSNRMDSDGDDLLDHIFLKGPDGKLAPARTYPDPQRWRPPSGGRCVILGPGRTHEETIILWSYVEKPAPAGKYQLSMELKITKARRGMEWNVKTWSGKIQSKTLEVAVDK
jgi:hypothetical protein